MKSIAGSMTGTFAEEVLGEKPEDCKALVVKETLQEQNREEISICATCHDIAKWVLSRHHLLYDGYLFYVYRDGVYHRIGDQKIYTYIKEGVTSDRFTKRLADEVVFHLRHETYVAPDELNVTPYLNLKNGLFDLNEYKLYSHTPEVRSTIQLDVSFNPDAMPKKFLNTLLQIFEGNGGKMDLIQEFFGYCLTKETKQEKSLICVGEGSNGKSVLLYVLHALLGRENVSAIPMEKFRNHFYLANLRGKLANISIETNAKSEVYDSTFKAVVSGDPIEVDHKFQKPLTFRPFAKLVFALNNMPRVDDKTDAFFRRLLIVRFGRVFPEAEQNKNLKYELVAEELDGIFLWALEGLRNLRERGYFRITADVMAEVADYRRENNNMLVFVDEQCDLTPDASISKQELYNRYSQWSRENGYRAVHKRRFGIELQRHFADVSDDRTPDRARTKMWVGICVSTDLRT